MDKKYYCPKCKNKLEVICGCGATSYFCDTCNILISSKKVLKEEEVLKNKK